MITIDTDVEYGRRLMPMRHDADVGIAQHVRPHLSERRTCREAEAEIIALLRRFRRAAVPPLAQDLEQRLLDACLSCDAARPSTGDGVVIVTAEEPQHA